MRDVLGSGNQSSVREFAEAVDRAGDPALALTARFMSAAQCRDSGRLKAIIESGGVDLIRSDAALHYALVVSLCWTIGLDGARAEIIRLSGQDLGALPADWRANASHLLGFVRLLGDCAAQITCEGESQADFLQDQPIPVIRASVNGQPEALFIVDTGAPTTVLDRQYAIASGVRFDMDNPKIAQDGAGNRIPLYPAVLDCLKVARAVAQHCPVHVMDFGDRMHVQGILSPLDSFSGLLIEFDFINHLLRMAPAEQFPEWEGVAGPGISSQNLIWNEGSPSVPVRLLSRIEAKFLVDTGAGANIICFELARELGLKPNSQGVVKGPTAAGEMPVYPLVSGELAIADSCEVAVPFMVNECPETVVRVFPRMKDGYLGVPWFQGRRVTFSPDARTMFFTPRISLS